MFSFFVERCDYMYLIVGLGNPGRDYKWTRHNVGFEVIDKLAYDYNITMNKNKFKAVIGDGVINGKKVILAQPQTYMNLSGESIRDLFNFYKFDIENLIVICDDVNLPVGDIRIRKKGSDGGQKGLYNIIYQLGRDDFPRIRVGVGNKLKEWDLKDFVLSKFRKEEDEVIISGITKAADALSIILSSEDGILDAMNKFNKKVKINSEN